MKVIYFLNRLYYIIFIIIREPYSIFVRYLIYKNLKSDWEKDTKYYLNFQKKSLYKIYKHAFNLKFYEKLIAVNELNTNSKIDEFPILNKSIIRNNFNSLYKKNFFIPKTRKNTGGSTGNPFYFYISPNIRDLEISHQLFFYKRVGYKRGDLIYSFDGIRIPKHFRTKKRFWIKKNWRNFPYGLFHFSALYINHENALYYIYKLLKDRPAFLRGYPSAIVSLTEYIIKEQLEHQFNFLKGILLTSETIDENQLAFLSKIYSCPILPQYGMSEICAFGFTKPNELRYYCSPYYGITEVLNNEGKHVEIGEIGEVVLTSLGNNIQPFIRYRTGDMAQYGGEKNGFTILNKIYGRTQDFIVTCENKKIMLVGLIFGAHMKAFENIKAWQIKQNYPGEIEVKIDSDINWLKENEIEVKSVLSCNNKIKILLTYGNDFETTSAGKRPFVIQKINANN